MVSTFQSLVEASFLKDVGFSFRFDGAILVMGQASFFVAVWLTLAGSGTDSWRTLYLLSRSKVYRVTCGTKQGVGFLYNDRNHIITSLSVAGCGRSVYVSRFGLSEPFKAELKAFISKHDIALLKVKHPLPGPPFRRTDEMWVTVGRSIAVIGHPYHPTGPISDRIQTPMAWSINIGVLGRVTPNYVQIGFERVNGYEGSPVIDRQGKVVGMITSFGPAFRPIGMIARAKLFEQLFTNPPPQQGFPYFSWGVHLQARFSFALGDVSKTRISPSNQEVRLDFIFWDQLTAGLFVGFDLLAIRTDLNLSLLFGLQSNYRLLMPRVFRPYLNYIAFEIGIMAMSLKIATTGVQKDESTIFNQVGLTPAFRFSFWVGLRFLTIAGEFSVGIFFDPESIEHPVLSVSWGL